MSGIGLGSSKKGARTADASMVTQFRRVYAQGVSDSTYSGDLKKNVFRTALSVVNTAAFGSANTTYGNMTGSSVVPAVTVPTAPVLLSLTSGSTTLTVAFTSPTNDGGSEITDYEYSVNGGTTFVSASTILSPFTITGLTNGTLYAVVLRAVNSVGSGDVSNSLSQTPNIVVSQFTTVGTTLWTAPAGLTSVNYLVVGGGGGGGGGHDTGGGGGGGAGMVRTGILSVTPGTSYTVTVGAGGAASTNSYPTVRETAGGDGGESVFASITSLGGNGGKGSRTQPGGSGIGGAAQVSSSSAGVGGSGGGNKDTSAGGSGGGGGGSSGAGGNGTSGSGGAGGAGTTSALSGSSVTYGVGGAGARGNTTVTGSAGTSNRGNGGSAGAAASGARNGGAGGSGIVILSY